MSTTSSSTNHRRSEPRPAEAPPGQHRGGKVNRLSRETLGLTALEALRASIMGGEFALGEHLIETALAEQLGISRGPLREALALLEKDGLIESFPHRGRYVVDFNTTDVDEYYGLRKVLETYAVELLIKRADRNSDRILQRAWSRIRDAADKGDSRRLALSDLAFHDALYQLTGDSVLISVWTQCVAGRLRMLVNLATDAHAPMGEESGNHRLILEAILGRDVRAARAHVSRHVDDAWSRIRRAVAGRASGQPPTE